MADLTDGRLNTFEFMARAVGNDNMLTLVLEVKRLRKTLDVHRQLLRAGGEANARAERLAFDLEVAKGERDFAEELLEKERAKVEKLREALRVARVYMGDWQCKCGREQCDICRVTVALAETEGSR